MMNLFSRKIKKGDTLDFCMLSTALPCADLAVWKYRESFINGCLRLQGPHLPSSLANIGCPK